VLNAAGELDLVFHIPNDPGLKDLTLYQQWVPYDTAVKEVSNLEATLFY
jgi:hypothetical protein